MARSFVYELLGPDAVAALQYVANVAQQFDAQARLIRSACQRGRRFPRLFGHIANLGDGEERLPVRRKPVGEAVRDLRTARSKLSHVVGREACEPPPYVG